MTQTDKQYLNSFAREVVNNIKGQQTSTPFNLSPKIITRGANTNGWSVKIGIFRGYQCSVEIWFDKFTAYKDRKIYYGVFSHEPDGVNRLVNLAKTQLGKHVSLDLSHLSEESRYAQLGKELNVDNFGRPIFETYPENHEFFYGVYEYRKIGLKNNKTSRLIERVVAFIISINESLSQEVGQSPDVYEGHENKKAVQRHIQRERNGHLAVMRKQIDNYVCKICKFKYTQKYGKLGKDFAEVHHIVPLAKNNEPRITTIDDLITVCADCHRMLHRMEGIAEDVENLKEIMRKQKAVSKTK